MSQKLPGVLRRMRVESDVYWRVGVVRKRSPNLPAGGS